MSYDRKESDRRYYLANKDKYKENAKRWKAANPERRKEIERESARRNPERIRKADRKRRARLAGVKHEPYTAVQVIEKYGDTCYLCGEDINLTAPRKTGVEGWERGLHLDHQIAIARGGEDTIANIRPTHGICNTRKLQGEDAKCLVSN